MSERVISPAPTATDSIGDRRVQPVRAAAGEVEVRPTQLVIQLQRDAGCRKEWVVEWCGKRYRADSYPDSDGIYIETERGRRLSPLVARRLAPLLREAIRSAP